MNQSNIQFNSKRAPGSVVVTKNGEPIAMIVKCTSDNSSKLKKGDWFAVATTLNEQLRDQITAVPFGTYDSVKDQVTKVLTQGDAS
jgi:antitoxin (DNA-binding transcriptional repressor) of toxin-antitoxin stability system